MRSLFAYFLVVALASEPVWAQSFLLTGELDDGDAPASGLFTFDLSIEDDADPPNVLWRESQPNIVVVAGVFAVEVGVHEPLTGDFDARAVLRVTIDGDVLPPIPLASFARVTRAAIADVADTAPSADRLGELAPSDAVRRSALAAPGGPTFPFAAITGLPSGVQNGDDGTDVVAAGQGLSISDRRLSVSVVNGNRFLPGAIAGGAFPTGSIEGTKLADGTVTGTKVASDLRRADLAAAVGEAQVAGRVIFQITAPGCVETGLSTRSTCTARPCDTPHPFIGVVVQGATGCDGTGCGLLNPTTCANNRLGLLVTP
jgi:hypothetical protein